jgi:hypothetical protein
VHHLPSPPVQQSELYSGPSFGFVGIANNLGTLIATAYRNGLTPLMNEQETSHYAIQVVLRAATREDFESKIGRLEYSIGKYEKLIRATVPIRLFGSNDDQSKFYYLLISFEWLIGKVVDRVIERILNNIGDNEGKIFVYDVKEAIDIKTKKRGESVL